MFSYSAVAASTSYAAGPGRWNVQISGGWYIAGDLHTLNDVDESLGDTLEALGIEPGEDLTFGARLGKRQPPTFGWEGQLGSFDTDKASEQLEQSAGVDLALWLFDLSLIHSLAGATFLFTAVLGSPVLILKWTAMGCGLSTTVRPRSA